MTDDPKKDPTSNEVVDAYRDNMLMDALLRITALENILVRKGLVSNEEIKEEIVALSIAINKSVAALPLSEDDLEQWIGNIKKDPGNTN